MIPYEFNNLVPQLFIIIFLIGGILYLLLGD